MRRNQIAEIIHVTLLTLTSSCSSLLCHFDLTPFTIFTGVPTIAKSASVYVNVISGKENSLAMKNLEKLL